MGAGDSLEKKKKKLPFTLAAPLPLLLWSTQGVPLITSQILRMDFADFFVPNTFQSGEGKGRGWGGGHSQPESVSVCESKVEVCSSATFYGKVSFPPLCLQQLPGIDRACGLCVCVYVCMCVKNRRCWFQRAAQEEAEFRPCWSL